VFVSIKPLHVSVFFRPSSGGPPLCFVPLLFLPLICLRWVCTSIITQYVAACVCHLCVFVPVCWWSACSQADHQQARTPNTHRWHIHAATHCVIIHTQRTQIGGRNSNGTKRSGGPPEDGRIKDRNMYGFYNYKHVFNILLVLNVEVNVF